MEDGARFEGEGDQETAAFETGPNWELQWTSEGDDFAVELIEAGAGSRGTIVETDEGGEGSAYVTEGGEFTLRVTADSSWELEISEPENG